MITYRIQVMILGEWVEASDKKGFPWEFTFMNQAIEFVDLFRQSEKLSEDTGFKVINSHGTIVWTNR